MNNQIAETIIQSMIIGLDQNIELYNDRPDNYGIFESLLYSCNNNLKIKILKRNISLIAQLVQHEFLTSKDADVLISSILELLVNQEIIYHAASQSAGVNIIMPDLANRMLLLYKHLIQTFPKYKIPEIPKPNKQRTRAFRFNIERMLANTTLSSILERKPERQIVIEVDAISLAKRKEQVFYNIDQARRFHAIRATNVIPETRNSNNFVIIGPNNIVASEQAFKMLSAQPNPNIEIPCIRI